MGTPRRCSRRPRSSGTETTRGKRFYHISTDEVYGALADDTAPRRTRTETSAEADPTARSSSPKRTKYDPHSPYSASKASSDHFVRAYPRHVRPADRRHRTARTTTGRIQFPEKLIPLFINNIRNDRPLPVYGKGAERTRLAIRGRPCTGHRPDFPRGENRRNVQHRGLQRVEEHRPDKSRSSRP